MCSVVPIEPHLLFLFQTLWLEACGSSGFDPVPSSPLSAALFDTVQPLSNAMMLFVWPYTIVGVARLLMRAYKECTHPLALPWGTRHLISPKLAGKDVVILFLLLCRSAQGRGERRALAGAIC